MTLLDCKKGEYYVVTAIHCKQIDLLQRFYAMGIYENSIFTLQHVSMMRHTFSINIYGTQVALRKNEAKKIEVKPQHL